MDQTSILARIATGFAARGIAIALALWIGSVAVHEIRDTFNRANAEVTAAQAKLR